MRYNQKLISILLLILPILVFFRINSPLIADIIWGESFSKGIELAKSKNTPVVIDMYTDWCAYCKDLETKIFPEPEVSKLLENFTTLRINGDDNPDIAQNFKVSGYPTVLFLDKNGAYLDRIVGLPSSQMMIKKLKEVYDKRNIEDQIFTSLKGDPENVVLNYRMGIYYFKANNFSKSESYFLKAINSPKNENPEKKMESLFIIGIIQIQEKKFSQAVSIWTKYLNDYPTGDESAARYYRGVSYFYSGKGSEAREDFIRSKFLATDPYRKMKIQEFLDKID
ncbi:MAG: DUF255 domain-containing protein [Spirochaetia bacterium]|nr:DUF255 domain-containing protein [Spirochaetia bacterium]